jgi:hypothetical protein
MLLANLTQTICFEACDQRRKRDMPTGHILAFPSERVRRA